MNANKRVAELSAPSLLRWFLGVGIDWSVITLALVFAWTVDHVIGYVVAVLVVGNRQHALELIGHDAAHGLASRKRWVNELVGGLFCFWPLLSGLGTYRKFHFSHHAHLGTDQDPEQNYKQWSPAQWDLPAPPRQIPKFFVRDLFGLSAFELLKLLMATPPPRVIDVAGPMLWHGAAVLACWWSGQWWILGIWYVASLTAFWAVFRLRMWTEHVGTRETYRVSVSWWQRVLFLPHNTWYHYEHHRWPAIPYWNLPLARALDTSEPVIPLNRLLASYSNT